MALNLYLRDLQKLTASELHEMAKKEGITEHTALNKQNLIALLRVEAIELLKSRLNKCISNAGFLMTTNGNYRLRTCKKIIQKTLSSFVLFVLMFCMVGCQTTNYVFERNEAISGIKVYRSVHIKQSSELEEARVTSLGFISKDENILMETVSFGGQRQNYFNSRGIVDSGYTPSPSVIRKSIDNGRTWKIVDKWQSVTPIHGRRELLSYSPNWVVNPSTGSILRMYITNESVRGTLPWSKGSPSGITRLIWTQLSYDGGETWSEPEQLVVRGEEYNHTHWAPNTYYGQNSAGIEGVTPLLTKDGRFLMPMFMKATPEMRATGVHTNSALLIGSWHDDDSGVDWDVSKFVHIDPAQGRDESEPSIAFLPDGRLLMTMRSRNYPNDGKLIQSAKFYTISDDLGQTWTDPQPLHYTDGGQVYCPASLAHVFVSAKNGRLYIITNLLDAPTTKGCDPRTTLHIAEIDPDTIQLIRDTVTVIETRNLAAGQPENIRFSNWRRYEDRENGNIVLFMTACPGDVGRYAECGVPPHSYRYDIVLPK